MSLAGNTVFRAHVVRVTFGYMETADLLARVSAESLAEMTGCGVRTARRWKRTGQLPEPARRLLALLVEGDLGALSPVWEHWALRNGQLCGPDGYCFHPGEVLSVPFLQRAMRAYQAEQRYDRQADWISAKWESRRIEGESADKVAEFTRPYIPFEQTLTPEEIAQRDRRLELRRRRGR